MPAVPRPTGLPGPFAFKAFGATSLPPVNKLNTAPMS
jgi:hypothetical protein